MGSSVTAAIASGTVAALRDQMRDDQVVLIVAPPHLIEKWQRELLSIHPNSIVSRLDRHEDVKAFMAKAARVGSGIPNIGLIKRDLTKLGSAREVAVVWRNQPVALWRHDQPTPEGYEPNQRIVKQRVPKCPHCGATITQERKGNTVPASESWLKSGKRSCQVCLTPLWQEARDRGSRPKPGHKYPPKAPRYRIDSYIKRHYSDRVYLLIWDEVHEGSNGATGNGEAFGRLAGVAQKVLGLTGTPFNGRASSLFNLEYHLNPRVRQRYPWGGSDRLSRKERGSFRFQTVIEAAGKQRGQAESRWVEAMGVRERVVEERPTYDSETGAYTGTSTYERPYEEAPGISPLLVAEMLDSTIYFSLADLGKALPRYEEIALPVEMDPDTYAQYDSTRSLLKDYLIGRKWEGDTSFRGSYLQWALGWPSAMFRPTEVVHNIKSPITGERRPHTVTKIPSFGEDRIYAKEQALIDLLTEELAAGRPCVVYLRQTGTRDIQPRIEKLVRDHVPGAVPYVLKNTVSAERREKVVEAERARGVNVLITNPELVKTGLDLLFTPTLIFYEVTFSLSTMMQASARSYRLNQTHDLCKTIYMYSVGTMEHTAVQLMSRKQRAAKLLSGDIGLTGLDQLTEGEGSFEAALMDAIAKDDVLTDPSAMFASEASKDYDTEDAAFWNVETASESADDTEQPVIRLLPPKSTPKPVSSLNERIAKRLERAGRLDETKLATVAARVTGALERGVPHPSDGTLMLCEGVHHPDFAKYPVHAEQLTAWLTKYLRSKKAADPKSVGGLAAALVHIASNQAGIRPQTTKAAAPKQTKAKRWKPDRMAVPDDGPPPITPKPKRSKSKPSSTAPTQPTLFPLPDDYRG